MAPFQKNLLVGLTVLGALLVLGWMILQFGDMPVRLFAAPTIPIDFLAPRADGLAEGSPVLYRGVNVGRVVMLARSEQDPTLIQVGAVVEAEPPLPGNVEGVIRSQLVGGGSTLSIELVGKQPRGRLEAGQRIPSRFVGVDVLPPEFSDLARDLQQTSRDFRESRIIENMDKTLETIRVQAEKAGQTLDALNEVISDQQVRENLKAAVSNFRSAGEAAIRVAEKLEQVTDSAADTLNKTQGHVDELAERLSARIEQIAKVLENFQSIAAKIDKGEGTAGLLINDPKLYQSLVDSTRQLNLTILDMRRLIEQWEQEGVSLKLR